MKVSEWETHVGYGSHRLCKNCGDATVVKDAYHYIKSIECAVKKEYCGSGAVKPSHSCSNWRLGKIKL